MPDQNILRSTEFPTGIGMYTFKTPSYSIRSLQSLCYSNLTAFARVSWFDMSVKEPPIETQNSYF